ncbi:unnamed protein product [Blepharisma stoltei]|uniref:Uncharacterized protein n=1 Tax=Blepharisma stoltei TaxID=1481888 RepID=A0AAU9JWB6_9CILI|nr:unnamed protein product [Blepharisma stoltei]
MKYSTGLLSPENSLKENKRKLWKKKAEKAPRLNINSSELYTKRALRNQELHNIASFGSDRQLLCARTSSSIGVF